MHQVVWELRTLREKAGERPPYVLVGHSSGGWLVRVFASTYRSDVAGLVLVDGFSVDLETAWIHPLLGDLRGEYEARLQQLRDTVAAEHPTRLAMASLVALTLRGSELSKCNYIINSRAGECKINL